MNECGRPQQMGGQGENWDPGAYTGNLGWTVRCRHHLVTMVSGVISEASIGGSCICPFAPFHYFTRTIKISEGEPDEPLGNPNG